MTPASGTAGGAAHGRPAVMNSMGNLMGDGMRINFAAGDNPAAQGFAFTRASAGNRINAAGILEAVGNNVQRRTWDIATGQWFWMHEQQATTGVPNTTTEYAATGGVSTTTIQADPFGATGAVLFTCLAGVSSHFAACDGVAYTAGTTYTLSKWVKEGTATRVQIAGPSAVFSTLDEYANFLLTGSGSVTAQGAGAIAAGIDPPVNGYRRCWITAVADVTLASAGGPVSFLLSTGLEARGPAVEGGGLTFTVFGSQVEAGPLTSYIIPAGATTTRAADSLTLTGSAGRTNWIKNSTGVGGTASALPTGWTSPLNQAGVGVFIVGTGTDAEHGNYWDVRFQGTATASGDLRYYVSGVTEIPSANGVQWAWSAAIALVSGSMPAGRSAVLTVAQRDSGGSAIGNLTSPIAGGLTGTPSRYSQITTTAHASVAYIHPWVGVTIVAGDVVDFTLRVAAPQAEKAAGFTGYIPTSGYARTVENIASWWNNDEGTFIWRGRVGPAFSLTAVMMAAAGDATMANAQWLYLSATARRVTGEGRSGGAATLSGMVMGSTIAAGQDVVASWAYGADYGLAVASGVAATADTSGALPVGMSRFSIGSGAASGLLTVASQLIASIEYYPRKLSQAEMLALTY